MTGLLLLVTVALRLQVSTMQPYEATLEHIRQQLPDTEVVLSTRIFRLPGGHDVTGGARSLPRVWLTRIRSRRLIERTCTPRSEAIGCASPSPTGKSTVVVLLGPLHRKGNQSTLNTWIIANPPESRPDWASIRRYTYTLAYVNGHWQVESAVADAVS